jgi:flavin reductase (DIM6/NTAB) family NADH-FMN oxidoreductase RutF
MKGEETMKKSVGARTVVYPTPVFAVGTYDSDDNANVMTAAWGGICCSSPPCIAVSLRKATYTYGNITSRKAFTISIPSEDYVGEADYFGIVSGRTVEKFNVTGLTPVKSDLVDAPYIDEFPFVLECTLLHTLEIGLHTQFIGEIVGVKAEESVLGKSDMIDIERVRPLIYAPDNQAYYGIGRNVGKAFSIGKRI